MLSKANGFSFLLAFSAIALSSAAVLEELEKPNCLILAKVDRATVHNYYYHNDEDCNSYYQCTAYGLAPKRCSEGLVFGESLLSVLNNCTYLINSNC